MSNWRAPKLPDNSTLPKLYLYNTLTRRKELFVPASGGNSLTWYNCGPTVYDASHMGHARTYITFDIIRRIMERYFRFNIFYVMNITDVDDKIILRARQSHLVKKFRQEHGGGGSLDKIFPIVFGALNHHLKKFEGFGVEIGSVGSADQLRNLHSLIQSNLDKFQTIGEKLGLYVNSIAKTQAAFENKDISFDDFVKQTEDILAPYLDHLHGNEITDHKIFQDLSSHWEAEYFKDMDALNVRKPDALTRVSEYVPEVIHITEKIISNGFGYTASDGSVYFDVEAFKKAGFSYAKLSPWAAGNSGLLEEGEGSLSSSLGKRNPNDFALWKASKPGEPFWESPWGKGRPGWHIECSAMSSDVIGETLDIHSGGIDLCFPHHDNEIAQTEACFRSQQWVNYFLHSGHLHIEGQKMSKSLKNFITIREALQSYTAAQIRIMFLMHSWDSVLDYKASSMAAAISVETTINNFLQNVKALGRIYSSSARNFSTLEKEFSKTIMEKQDQVHNALVDNINTPEALSQIMNLISKTNVYIKTKEDSKQAPNLTLLGKVHDYVVEMMEIFGLPKESSTSTGGHKEEILMPFLDVIAKFRSSVRDLARSKAEPGLILKECDKIRDETLPSMGVVLEDKGDVNLIKFIDPATLQAKKREEEQLKAEKEARLREAEQKRLEKLEKGKIDPREMFKSTEYSKWDEQGVPTHDSAGEELAKSRRKKLQKEYQSQEKLHQEYLSSK